jgi:predicted AlkP superfamily phosphohydrolase/phosphomutase
VSDASPAPTSRRRLLILGLDGVPPELLFDRMRPVMPTIDRLLERGLRAPLRTTDPPLSVPAWVVMFTGVDPGTLGVYGLRHRRPTSYTQMYVPGSGDLPVPTIWQTLSERGYRVAVMGIPLGYPPPHIAGAYISDFLTPAGSPDYIYPSELKEELESRFGPYTFDVTFRASNRDTLLEDLLKMTKQRFEVAAWLYGKERWDVFALHEIGTDRLHHAYWKYFDPSHPRHEPGNPYEESGRVYYAALDRAIAGLLEKVDPATDVLIVSDHGAMAMSGCFCINEWMERQGYLVLKRPPEGPGTPLAKAEVDWSRTTAWGEGGYYARIFLNVKGREPEGLVSAEDVPEFRRQLAEELGQVPDPSGAPLGVRVLDPHTVYQNVRGDAPDLMAYFGELKWRSAGTVGNPGLFLYENDTGPDDAVHSWDGVLVYVPGRGSAAPELAGTELSELAIRDVAPTVLALLGEVPPAHVQGRPILAITSRPVPEAPPMRPVPAPALLEGAAR